MDSLGIHTSPPFKGSVVFPCKFLPPSEILQTFFSQDLTNFFFYPSVETLLFLLFLIPAQDKSSWPPYPEIPALV